MITSALEHPNQAAERLIGRDYISWSAISTYQSCPLRFYFRYVQGLPEKTVSSSLVFGAAIHAVVQFHYEELLAGAEPPDLDTLLAVYQAEWKERDQQTIRFGQTESVDSLSQLAERVLAAFQASDVAAGVGRIVAVEETLRGEIVPGFPDLLARIDLLAESDDAVTVTDFKTSRSRWSAEQAAINADQLLLYSQLLREVAPGKPLRLQFVVLTKTKQPAVEAIDVPYDPQQVERTWRIAQEVWRSIEAGRFWPNPSLTHCPACPFRAECRAWV
ncbi:MAG: PD-(D/E)XK nuclease family protein [Planctomycetota bacterium]|nr:MAG: PD-(D/E)XK nuclease family protein [Planctomycetota bacterium]REJ87706.1 MAG: PD-(D/E)XK nuclease family protein [Planctomycetota bacterium]REK27790.1 MAG: PD-(D/E)XK nuclease family protein [Planctomycetota bacterium]REK34415.1 MAG: PD-(D/E)XK nuclease family protein [Planctomycetota bacterium]